MKAANPARLRKALSTGVTRNPLDIVEHEHKLQAQLCDALERIADGLPSDVDRRLCVQVASQLRYDIPAHHRDEEDGLFPLLARRAADGDNISAIMARLAQEHAADESFAGEITEEIEALAEGRAPRNPEMLGYMLRGFFESYRRHIHWENTLVLPLARERLTADDLDCLSRSMAANRAQRP